MSDKAIPLYSPPEWGGRPAPGQPAITLDIIRNGVELGMLDLGGEMDRFTFGRVPDGVTFVVDNPMVSRLHAVIQFKKEDGTFYLYDVNSTHGTFVNREKVEPGKYVELHVGDSIQFGTSTRMYLVNGPDELLPPEAEGDEALEELRATRATRQASIEARLERRRRAKEARSKAMEQAKTQDKEEEEESGISWGMDEDAVEEEGDEQQEGGDEDGSGGGKKKPMELPDYLKNLPEHQRRLHEAKLAGGGDGTAATTLDASEVHERDRKLYEKLRAKVLKVENMQTEISRIYAKEGSQGGLSDGQRAAVARNEERIVELQEQIEEIEEQIRGKNAQRERSGSVGSRSKKESEDEGDGEDGDEFYDRTEGGGAKGGGNWRARKVGKRARGGGAASQHTAHGAGQAREAETLESLTQKAESCRKEIAALKQQIASAGEDSTGAATEGGGAKEDDSLESFMAQNDRKGKDDARKAAERRVVEVESELVRLEALIKIVRPAMPTLHSRPPPTSPRPTPRSPPSPVMAPPSPHPPISPRTIDLHAPQPLAPPPLDLDTVIPHPDADPFMPHPPHKPPSSPTAPSDASPAKVVKGPAMPPPPTIKGPAKPPPAVLGTAAFLPSNQKKRKEPEEGGEEAGERKKPGKATGGKDAGSSKRDASSEAAAEADGEGYVGFFMRPKGQKGDGRTSLNEKLGY